MASSCDSLITNEMLEQISVLIWARTGNTQLAELLAAAKLAGQLYERFSGQNEVDALQSQVILKISKYVKDHPKASKEELSKEIGRQIQIFAQQIENII